MRTTHTGLFDLAPSAWAVGFHIQSVLKTKPQCKPAVKSEAHLYGVTEHSHPPRASQVIGRGLQRHLDAAVEEDKLVLGKNIPRFSLHHLVKEIPCLFEEVPLGFFCVLSKLKRPLKEYNAQLNK